SNLRMIAFWCPIPRHQRLQIEFFCLFQPAGLWKIEISEFAACCCQQGRVTLCLKNVEGPPVECFGLVQMPLLYERVSQIIQAGRDERVVRSKNPLANFQTPFQERRSPRW